MKNFRKQSSHVLPGFGLSMGITLFFISFLLILPLCALFIHNSHITWQEFWRIASDERVKSALSLSFFSAIIAATINLVVGMLVAWVLVRYRFRGRKMLDSLVDFPFALPTAVTGITLTSLYDKEGLLGGFLQKLGIEVVQTQLGIVLALVFIGFPFVVRSIQPILNDMNKEMEEAAKSLGANNRQFFWRVVLPTILPAALTGFSLALARGVGEYGSIIFIAGNFPYVSEIAPLLIAIRVDEEAGYESAGVIALLMMALSFLLLLVGNLLQRWTRLYSK